MRSPKPAARTPVRIPETILQSGYPAALTATRQGIAHVPHAYHYVQRTIGIDPAGLEVAHPHHRVRSRHNHIEDLRIVMKRTAALGALLGITLLPLAVSGANETASLTVSATVTNNCTISTAALTFAPYDPVVANATNNLDGTGRVTVACTKGASPTIGLGSGSSASGSARRLADGSGNFLSYELYQDSGHSQAWANSGLALLTAGAATSKTARDFTVYGRIAGNQDVPAGSYADTVVATVNF
jgi:spore coat protein U-like protein